MNELMLLLLLWLLTFTINIWRCGIEMTLRDVCFVVVLFCSAIIGRNMELFKKHLFKFAYAMPAVGWILSTLCYVI